MHMKIGIKSFGKYWKVVDVKNTPFGVVGTKKATSIEIAFGMGEVLFVFLFEVFVPSCFQLAVKPHKIDSNI